MCLYGLENRDIIALIDARRIMRDIKYHIFEVPYFKEGDAIVEINEEDYSIYYGASEVLEGDRYKQWVYIDIINWSFTEKYTLILIKQILFIILI